MELIAHRAGNRPGGAAAARHADLVELDVHLHRGRLEVRHEKRLWPTARLWERWYVLPADHPRRTLADALAELDDDVHLYLDLKGVSPRLASAVRTAVAGRARVSVSTKSWWLLARTGPGARTFRSAGNRFELALALALPSRVRPHGVVLHQRLVTPARVARLRARGTVVWSWGAADRVTVDRLVAAGVTGLILDDLDLLASLRAEWDGGTDRPA